MIIIPINDRSVMVVGHQHRYKNSRIVTLPKELDSDIDSRRIPDELCLYSGVDLTWFLITINGSVEGDEIDDELESVIDDELDKMKIAGFSHDQKNQIKSKLEDSERISNVIRIENNTRNNSDIREHEGTKVINIPHRLTPEYTVTEGNDFFSIETKKEMDQFRELADEALFGPKEDIVFVLDRTLTSSSHGITEPIYLLFDWNSLCALSTDYFELVFEEIRDREYVIDAQTGGKKPAQGYFDAVSRVLDLLD